MPRSIEAVKGGLAGPYPGVPRFPTVATRFERLWRSLATPPPKPGLAIDTTIPLFDAETLAELCGDIEPDTLTTILADFIEDMRLRLDRIATATAAANLRVVVFESHALSGCSQTFGALRLASVCRDIEQAVDDGNGNGALALARSLGRIGTESLVALSAYRRIS